jgi:hypothetical protein
MSRDATQKFRVRCSEDADGYGDNDPIEYFKTLGDATKWARKAARAGRFKRLIIQDMSGGYGRWTVLEEIIARRRR